MLTLLKKASIKSGFFEETCLVLSHLLNVGLGKEEFGDGHNPKTMVEVAVVAEILSNLLKGDIY